MVRLRRGEVMEKKRFRLHMPHVFVILFFLVLVASVSTWIIPPGQFDYEAVDVNGTVRELVVPGSFHYIDRSEASPTGIIDFFCSFHRGMIEGAEIMMMIFIVNAAFGMIVKTGAFDCMMGALLRKFDGKEKILVPLFFLIYALGGTLFGMWNDFNGLIPIMVGMGIALGYDALFGFSVIELGIGIGFGAAIMNPYTIVIAQSIAGIPVYSNSGIRIAMFVIFSAISLWWIFRYGKKIKADPSKSLMSGEKTKFKLDRNELVKLKVGTREKLVLADILICLGLIMYGFLRSGWGTIQLTGVFLMMGIAAALIYRWSPDKIAEEFVNGCADIVFGALIVGIARATLVVLQDGMVIDTIINTMANLLTGLPSAVAAQGMLLIQSLINFIIPSGSGQATTIIPIMAPLGDLMGVSREMTVLTFQMGDGLSNLLWPTSNIAVGCGISGVPLSKWWKFFLPLYGLMYLTQMLIIVFAQVFLGF